MTFVFFVILSWFVVKAKTRRQVLALALVGTTAAVLVAPQRVQAQSTLVQVIQAVLNVNLTWLAVAAVLFSVVGAFFYLRIVKLMYFDAPVDSAVIGGSMLMRTVLSANALLVFALGVAPAALITLCQQALP